APRGVRGSLARRRRSPCPEGSRRRRRRPPRSARSVAPVALFPPRISVVVVPVCLPEAGLIARLEAQPANPLPALPEVEVGNEHPRRAAVLGLERLAAVAERHPRLAAGQVLERHVGRVAAVAILDDV